jgi:hypothetical protein
MNRNMKIRKLGLALFIFTTVSSYAISQDDGDGNHSNNSQRYKALLEHSINMIEVIQQIGFVRRRASGQVQR